LANVAIAHGLKAYLYKCNHRDEIATAALHRLIESMRPQRIAEDIMTMLGQEPPPEITRVPKPSPEEIERGYAFALGNHQPNSGPSAPTLWKYR
jgi:hypothetical protein